jgi:hypothetical protein
LKWALFSHCLTAAGVFSLWQGMHSSAESDESDKKNAATDRAKMFKDVFTVW